MQRQTFEQYLSTQVSMQNAACTVLCIIDCKPFIYHNPIAAVAIHLDFILVFPTLIITPLSRQLALSLLTDLSNISSFTHHDD